MTAFLWVLLPLFVAAGSALLAFYVMQARLEVAVALEREALAEARAMAFAQQKTIQDKVKAAAEESKRKALDGFLEDIRVEERHYERERKSLFLNRKSVVLQERLYFRNIPLSDWIEHEMVVEDGGDIEQLASACSSFGRPSLGAGPGAVKRSDRLLR